MFFTTTAELIGLAVAFPVCAFAGIQLWKMEIAMTSVTYYDKNIRIVSKLELKHRVNDKESSIRSKREALNELNRRELTVKIKRNKRQYTTKYKEDL